MQQVRAFLISFKLVWITAAVSLVASKRSLGQKENPNPPNIVFILADDLGYGDVGAYGQQIIKTPNIDRLARKGIMFTDFYSGSTVCAPSRAALMTGQHTGQTYIRGNGELPLRVQDTILSQRLKQAGYINGMVGKWGLGLPGTSGAPEKKGWDFFTGHIHHMEGHFQQGDSIWKIINGQSTKVAVPTGTYFNQLFTDQAVSFIEQNKRKPFFLYVSYTLPHAELIVPGKYLKKYQRRDGSSIFSGEVPHPDGRHYGQQSQPKAAYAAMVTQMDDYIGRIIKQLKKHGLEDNTIIIFTSDNGTHAEGGRTRQDSEKPFESSGPLKGIKRDLYEGGIRIPFIVQWPLRIEENTSSNHLAAFWDLLPTLTEAAGKPVQSQDGISFLPTILCQPQQLRHEYLYWEFYEGGFKQAVRQGDWKAIRFYKGPKPVRTELYNLKEDIGELNDLSQENPVKVKALEALMDKAHQPSQSSLFQISTNYQPAGDPYCYIK